MKTIKVLVGFAALLLLTGCTALLWQENEVVKSRTVQNNLIQDTILGVFHYKNLNASVIQAKKRSSLNIPSEGIAFLGETSVYILTEGASELLDLDGLNGRIALATKNESGLLRLQLTRGKKGDAVAGFEDTLFVKVKRKPGVLTAEEKNVIEQSGFRLLDGRYVTSVKLRGVIIPRKNLSYRFSETQTLKKKYRVVFYSIKKETDFHPLNLTANIALTPLTLTADIIFLPISLGILGLINNPPTH